jgi:hypothetical protein
MKGSFSITTYNLDSGTLGRRQRLFFEILMSSTEHSTEGIDAANELSGHGR